MNPTVLSYVGVVSFLFFLCPLNGRGDIRYEKKINIAPYKMASFEIEGSKRLSREAVQKIIQVKEGAVLDHNKIMEARSALIKTGLYRSVLLKMKKGSEKGWVKLIAELEDDLSVFSEQAYGLSGGLQYKRLLQDKVTEDQYNYEFKILSRNFFRKLHQLSVDITGSKKVEYGQLIYLIPSFTSKNKQLRFESLYIDSQKVPFLFDGFHESYGAMMIHTLGENSRLEYGVESLMSSKGFLTEETRKTIGGKLSFLYISTLSSYIPQSGYHFHLNILLPADSKSTTVSSLSLGAVYPVVQNMPVTLLGGIKKIGREHSIQTLTLELNTMLVDFSQNRSNISFFLNSTYKKFEDKSWSSNKEVRALSLGFKKYNLGFITEFSFVYANTMSRD